MNIIEIKEPRKEIAGEPTTLSIQAYIFDIEKAPELMKDLEVLAQKYTVLVEVHLPLIEVVSQEKEKANDGPDALDINLNDFR